MKNISIVTGGSSGLGKAVARELIQKGERVCLIARGSERLRAAAEELGKAAICECGDLCDEDFVRQVFARLKEKGYYADSLFQCAGIGRFGAPERMYMKDIRAVLDCNTAGLMCMAYEACRNMDRGGTIVNIMSTSAQKGNAEESLYCASKWAVRGFTEALRAYYAKGNIRVIGVYPGGMNTPFWNGECGMAPDVGKFMDAAEVAKIIVDNADVRNTCYVSDLIVQRIAR